MPSTKTSALKGKVIGFNVSPKGIYESMLLDVDSRTVQVNFAPESANDLTEVLKEGSKAEVIAEVEGGKKPSDHPVYRLISLEAPDMKPRRGGQVSPENKTAKVTGKVIRLNYAKHGEVNGAILDNGCFVHLKPEGAKEVRLKVGQFLEVEGEEKPTPTHRVLDVYQIGDREIRTKKAK